MINDEALDPDALPANHFSRLNNFAYQGDLALLHYLTASGKKTVCGESLDGSWTTLSPRAIHGFQTCNLCLKTPEMAVMLVYEEG